MVLKQKTDPGKGAPNRCYHAGHRRHAEIENAIRDLKYGVGLNHRPSGRFAANASWLAAQTMAHNLARWTARIGLGEQIVTTKTLRRRFFSLAGRLTRSARLLTLHLPKRWPWEEKFAAPWPGCEPFHSQPDDPSATDPTSPQTRATPVRECLLLRPRPLHLALRNVRRRSRGLPAAADDRHRPHLPEIVPGSSPLAPHRPFRCCNVIASVDSGLKGQTEPLPADRVKVA